MVQIKVHTFEFGEISLSQVKFLSVLVSDIADSPSYLSD